MIITDSYSFYLKLTFNYAVFLSHLVSFTTFYVYGKNYIPSITPYSFFVQHSFLKIEEYLISNRTQNLTKIFCRLFSYQNFDETKFGLLPCAVKSEQRKSL